MDVATLVWKAIVLIFWASFVLMAITILIIMLREKSFGWALKGSWTLGVAVVLTLLGMLVNFLVGEKVLLIGLAAGIILPVGIVISTHIGEKQK